jgi:hypothetical protein
VNNYSRGWAHEREAARRGRIAGIVAMLLSGCAAGWLIGIIVAAVLRMLP